MDQTSNKIPQDNVINLSKDYDSFKRILGNRPIYPAHVAAIVEAMRANPTMLEYNPILVNERKEIIDGQHRVEAAKELNLPIHYIMRRGLRLSDTQTLNSGSKPWGVGDYAQSFADIGKVDYKIYIEMKEKYPLSHDILRYILSHNNCTLNMFKTGKFAVVKLLEGTDFMDKLMDFSGYYQYYTDRAFVVAFQNIYRHPEYNHAHMVNQLSKNPDMLVEAFDANDYLAQLTAIYNNGLPLESNVRFI